MIVTSIDIAGPDRRARRLHFEGEMEPRTTSAAAAKACSIDVGTNLDLDELAMAEADLAKDRALRYLGYRDRSRHEVVQRLLNDGYPRVLALSVRDRLCELGFLDDARLAHAQAALRLQAGYGPRRVEQELTRRGIDPELVAEAMTTCDSDPLEAAIAVLGSRTYDSPKERQRLIRRLVARGFALSVAIEAVGHAGLEGSDESPFISI